MSGNPFRQSQFLARSPAVAPSPTLSFVHPDSSSNDGVARDQYPGDASPRPPVKTKKSVRIESPTSTIPQPEYHEAEEPLSPRVLHAHHAESSPPTSPTGFSDHPEEHPSANPPGRANSGDNVYGAWDMTEITRRNPGMAASVHSPSGAPVNPFSRTLATIESQGKGGAELAHAAGQNTDRASAEKPGTGTPKANLDVESFKRLLMTGISSPSSSSPSPNTATAPNPVAASAFESSSTDTSSVSRQSIFEPALQEPHMDTPRTSYEMAPSDEERVGLVTEVKKTEKKKPPPAPKHRHGKLVSSRTPQIVSFDEFEATQFSPSPISRKMTDSDLNKPLPPTPPVASPPAHIISQDISQDTRPPLETRTSESSIQSQTSPPQKRIPPPVPLARRQSQLRNPSSTRSRSNSNLTMSSQHSISEFPMMSPSITSEPSSSPSQKAAPPPPPARRHGTSLTGNNPPSNNSSTTELASHISSRRSNISSPTSRDPTSLSLSSPPLPEPQLQSGLSRSQSTTSTRTPRSVSNESSNSHMPPPPPPPRRRQSGRSSLDRERERASASASSPIRRTSSENKRSSFEGMRRTSVASESSLKYSYSLPVETREEIDEASGRDAVGSLDAVGGLEPAEKVAVATGNSTDILDDMEKFQREIDELRERYRKGSG